MRAAFSAVLLVLAGYYTMLGFTDLNFLSARGRIGPGFFPQIIGVLLTGFLLYSLVIDLRRVKHDQPISDDWQVVAGVAALAGVLIIATIVLGALPGMVLFMLLALFTLNRGRPVQNLVVGLVLPTAMFVLFRYWLNATMPTGMLGLAI